MVQANYPVPIGIILPDVDCCGLSSGHPAKVVSRTDRQDFMEQIRLAGYTDRPGAIYNYFYRVTID